MSSPQQLGREFEEELADEFGLKQVPGSGSVWHSKLDMQGNNARWSLKFTGNASFPIKFTDIVEALEACYGVGGDGATPIWAARIEQLDQDFIVMRKEDWVAFNINDIQLINTDRPQVAARKKRARTPELLREEE